MAILNRPNMDRLSNTADKDGNRDDEDVFCEAPANYCFSSKASYFDASDVETASRDICGQQDVQLFGAEPFQRVQALRLRHVAVKLAHPAG